MIHFRFAFAIAAALSLAGCDEKPAPAEPNAPQQVEAVPVESAMMESALSLQGQLVAQEQVDVFARVAGFIETIHVDRGSRVSKGDVLVRISAPELHSTRAGVESALAAALAKANADALTAQRLANASRTPGVVAENDVNIARQAAAASRAQVAAARAALASSQQVSNYLTIRAPFSGVITERNLHPGALVGPSAGTGSVPILRMASAGTLRLSVAVPAEAVSGVAIGQPVPFTIPNLPGRPFTAPLARKAGAIDPRSRSMMVELAVPNGAGELSAGGFATVKWPFKRIAPSLLVPTTAIANDQQRQFVIRIAGGKAEWIDVTTGMAKDGKVEAFGKLAAGDTIILRGTDAIKEGTALKPVKPAPPAPVK